MIVYSCDICATDILDVDSNTNEPTEEEIGREEEFSIAFDTGKTAYTEEIKISINSENSHYCEDCFNDYIIPGLIKELLSKLKARKEENAVSQG